METNRVPRLPRATEMAHRWVTERLRPGDRAIDATVGNGHDTAFLAERVGQEGRVEGFDVQPEAIAASRHRLAEAGLLDRVILHEAGHETMKERISADWRGTVRAVMFNLGYLPGGDKECITQTETTLVALNAALDFLAPGGLLTVVAYPGHSGGDAETAAVEAWAEGLSQEAFAVIGYRFLNQVNRPPRLIAVERRRVKADDSRLAQLPHPA